MPHWEGCNCFYANQDSSICPLLQLLCSQPPEMWKAGHYFSRSIMLQCSLFIWQCGPSWLVGTGCHSPGPAHRGLTTWLGAMASWEWNVECCVCRAPFPASLTAQAHANDQYYWSTIDGLATKQEKLITTKALLSFNYWSSMAISAAQRRSPTLISNKMWCRWKNLEDER